jgi:hypothetical protein
MNDPRVQTLLSTLPSPEILEQQARTLPPPLGPLLQDLAGALRDPKPASALGALLQGQEPLLRSLQQALPGQLATAQQAVEAAEREHQMMEARLGRLLQELAGLSAAVQPLLDQPGSPSTVIERTLRAAEHQLDESVLGQLSANLTASRAALVQALNAPKDIAGGPPPELPSGPAEGQPDIGETTVLLGDMRQEMAARGRPQAELAAAQAALLAGQRGPDDAATLQAWSEVFICAEQENNLQLARDAARALQAGNPHRVVQLALRLLGLADRAADPVESVWIRLEAALAASICGPPRPLDADRVNTLLAEADARAAGQAPHVVARVALTRGEVAEAEGRHQDARRDYRNLVQTWGREPRAAREVGRAALRLGRLLLREGHGTQARDALHLAQAVSMGIPEWSIFEAATEALFEQALQSARVDRAAKVLADFSRSPFHDSPEATIRLVEWTARLDAMSRTSPMPAEDP